MGAAPISLEVRSRNLGEDNLLVKMSANWS